jgi:hypothetical protein
MMSCNSSQVIIAAHNCHKASQLQQQNHPDQIQIVGEKNQYCNQAEV